MSRTDSVRVSTVVDVAPDVAFEVFTGEIDLWWKRGPRFRAPADQRLAFEPGVGGRLLAYRESGEAWEIGRVLAWEVGKRLVFEWRAASFDADQRTEVEVLFEAEGDATRVSLEHRGWDAIPLDHPVRHGLADEPAFRAFFGHWWTDLLFGWGRHCRSSR
jgi:uncharacterized protein YndB with AHSA1/START domain